MVPDPKIFKSISGRVSSFFGAELCDLVGLYALSKLRHLYNYKDIGLYRNDGLAIISRKVNKS